MSALAFQSQNRLSSLQQRLDTASRGQQLTTADSLQQLATAATHSWTLDPTLQLYYYIHTPTTTIYQYCESYYNSSGVLTTLDYLSWSIFYNIFIFSNTAVNSNVHKMFIKTSLSFHFIWTIIFALRTKIWMFPSHNEIFRFLNIQHKHLINIRKSFSSYLLGFLGVWKRISWIKVVRDSLWSSHHVMSEECTLLSFMTWNGSVLILLFWVRTYSSRKYCHNPSPSPSPKSKSRVQVKVQVKSSSLKSKL